MSDSGTWRSWVPGLSGWLFLKMEFLLEGPLVSKEMKKLTRDKFQA